MASGIFLPLTVFVAGILSFFAPCIVPLLPVYMGSLSSQANQAVPDRQVKGKLNKRLILQTLVFTLGLSTIFITLGFGFGAIGNIFTSKITLIISGAIVIILGLHQIGLFHINFLEREKKVRIRKSTSGGVIGSFLLGFTFSLGWTPCVGPVLATVLGLASGNGTALYGGFLMAVYSLGLALPFILISVFAGFFLEHLKKVNRHLDKIRIAGGILIVIMGILLMTDSLHILSNLFTAV
ncbi:MAG: sulfite exporter TauE/SafE family protein [Clostridia bacterium]|nr:sulfite exporter TauE/SafE family protein [Clostridia bacterium]